MHARHGRRRGLVSGIWGCWIKPLSFGMSGLGYYRMWSWNLIVIPLIWCPKISGMVGDHGNVHVVDFKRGWDSKIDEAQCTGKVVSVFWSFTHEDHVPIYERRFNSHKSGYCRHKRLWVKSDVTDIGTTRHGYELWTGCGGFHGHLVWTMPPHVRFGKAGFLKGGYRKPGLEKRNVGQPIFAMRDVENSVLGGQIGQTWFLLSQISQAGWGKLDFREGGFNKPGFRKGGFGKLGLKKPDLANPILATGDLEYVVSQGRIWQTRVL